MKKIYQKSQLGIKETRGQMCNTNNGTLRQTILAAIVIMISQTVSETKSSVRSSMIKITKFLTPDKTANPSTFKSKHTTIYIIARILCKERESRPDSGASTPHEDWLLGSTWLKTTLDYCIKPT